MESKDLKISLEALGLSRNESAVYLALLEEGLTQAGPLIRRTKLHRMLVYEALERLGEKGLCSLVHKKNIKLFQPAAPDILVEKTKHLTALAHALIPSLRRLQKQEADVSIRTLVGREGYITNLQEVVESAFRQKNKLICIIGGARDTDAYEIIGDWYDDYVALLQKKNVKKRLLAPEPFSNVFKRKFAQEKDTELCTLPHGLSSPTYTRITKEMVTIEILKPSVVVIQIRNKAVARSYLDAYELLWKQLKKRM